VTGLVQLANQWCRGKLLLSRQCGHAQFEIKVEYSLPRLRCIGRHFGHGGVACIRPGQYRSRRSGRFRGGYEGRDPRTQEQEMMQKAIDPAFSEDVFTFARLKFNEESGRGWGRTWDDDTPNADLMLTSVCFR